MDVSQPLTLEECKAAAGDAWDEDAQAAFEKAAIGEGEAKTVTGNDWNEYVESKLPVTLLSDDQREEFTEAFKLFDKNDEGLINTSDLHQIYDSLGLKAADHWQEKQCRKMGLEEFLILLSHRKWIIHSEDDALCAFKTFDKDGTGFISREQLSAALEKFGEKLTDHEIDVMLHENDVDTDGNINYKEFTKTLFDRRSNIRHSFCV